MSIRRDIRRAIRISILGDGIAIPSDAPANFAAVAASSAQIDLSWDAVEGAIGYDIERGGVVIVTDQAGTTYSDTGRTAGTEYSYRVRARNAGGEGPWTDAVAVYTLPGVPANFKTRTLSPTEIRVTWNSVTSATGYDVERDGVVVSSNQAGTTFNDSDLTADTNYSYRVRARNSSGPGSYSSASAEITVPDALVAGYVAYWKGDGSHFEDSARTMAATDDGDVIGSFTDESGNGHHFFTTSTPLKPTLQLAEVNGKAVILFGTGDELNINDHADFDVNAHTLFVAQNATGSIHVLRKMASNSGYRLRCSGGSNWFYDIGDGSLVTLDAGAGNTHAIVSARHTGTAQSLWIGRTLADSDAQSITIPNNTDPVAMSASSGATTIWAAIIYGSALSDANVLKNQKRLAYEWGQLPFA